MAKVVNLVDIMTSDENDTDRPTSPKKRQKSSKNKDVLDVQKMLVKYNLPIGKKDPLVPDGKYGPITHQSLKTFANAIHTDSQVKSKASTIRKLITDDWRKMGNNLKSIASIISTSMAVPSPSAGPSAGKPDDNKEQFDIDVIIDGKKIRFPFMAAVRSPGHLIYTLEVFGLYNRNDSVEDKVRKIREANRLLWESAPNNWIGAKTLLSDYSKFLIKTILNEAKGKQSLGKLIDWLSARFTTIMPNIPRAWYPKITRYVYTLDPKMVSSPNIDAEITDIKSLRSFTSTIHYQLILLMRDAPVSTVRPKPVRRREPNVNPGMRPRVETRAPDSFPGEIPPGKAPSVNSPMRF